MNHIPSPMTSPDSEMIRHLDQLLTDYTNITDMAAVFVDIRGRELSKRYKFSNFCKFMRSRPETCHLCYKCDLIGGLEATKQGSCQPYRCHAGLIDMAFPVIMNAQLAGFILTGQIVLSSQNVLPYIISSPYGNMDTNLKKAYNQLPRYTLEEVESAARTLKIMTEFYFPTGEGLLPAEESGLLESTNYATSPLSAIQCNHPEIQKVLQYIDQHLTGNLNLRDMAQHVYLSESYLSRLFKKEMQMTLVQYITERRIQHAKMLLNDTSLSIESISKSLGFQQPNYFCRVFKKVTNETPESFRKKPTILTPLKKRTLQPSCSVLFLPIHIRFS